LSANDIGFGGRDVGKEMRFVGREGKDVDGVWRFINRFENDRISPTAI
jgi:hypothetical protein